MEFSNKYIIGFALALCLVCSIAVSTTAVALKDLQDANIQLDTQTQILRVAGLVGPTEKPSVEKANELYTTSIREVEVETATGNILGDGKLDSKVFIRALKTAMPDSYTVLEVTAPGKECYVFLVWGNGLWSTMYGYIAIEADKNTVKGLTFYTHGETPGLGGEIDSDDFKDQWPGKKLFDENGVIAIDVMKKGKVKLEQHQVDGISGATITSVAVGELLQKWFNAEHYGNFLTNEAN
ncbi:MAG: Na+-transporting NADH:ubiquinone oxidoreductase subunit C [Myxococcota bacterium]